MVLVDPPETSAFLTPTDFLWKIPLQLLPERIEKTVYVFI